MIRNNVNLRIIAIIAALSIVSAGCSSEKSSGGTGASTSSSASTSTVDTTPDTVETTIASTTTVPEPIVYTLRWDGLGEYGYGELGFAGVTDLIDTLTAEFGAPVSDDSQEYPADDGFGGFQTVDGEFGFAFPFGRTVCWTFEFCLEFGGVGAATQFVGWSYGEDSGATLSAESGLTIGSRWSDFPAINVHAGGCYSIGTGDIDLITLTLMSDDVAFTSFDESGNYVENIPPPEQVSVVFMEAGDIPTFLFGDC